MLLSFRKYSLTLQEPTKLRQRCHPRITSATYSSQSDISRISRYCWFNHFYVYVFNTFFNKNAFFPIVDEQFHQLNYMQLKETVFDV